MDTMVQEMGREKQRFFVSVEDRKWVERSGWRTVAEVLACAPSDVVALSSSSDVVRVPLDSTLGGPPTVFVKRYDYSRRGHRIKQMFRGTFFGRPRARREYEFLSEMANRHVPTVRPIAYGEERRRGFVRLSFLVTEGIEGFRSLDVVALEHLRSHTLSRRDRSSLTAGLATTIGNMHERGVRHGGLFWRNILVRRNADGDFDFSLLDPDSHGQLFPARVPKEGVLADLSELVASGIGLGLRGGIVAFMKSYFRVEQLSATQRQVAAEVLSRARPLAVAEKHRMAVAEALDLVRLHAVDETSRLESGPEATSFDAFFEARLRPAREARPASSESEKTILFVVSSAPGVDGELRRSVTVGGDHVSVDPKTGSSPDLVIRGNHDALLAVLTGRPDGLARLRGGGFSVSGDINLLPVLIGRLRRLGDASSVSAADGLGDDDSARAPEAVTAGSQVEQRAFGKKYKSEEYARYYSQKHGSSLMRRVSNYAERRMIRRALARVQRERPFRSVLDCPSGTGRFIPLIRDLGVTLITMDTSADMLQKGRVHFASFPVSPSAIAGSAFDVPLADNAVDVVLCSRLLHHIPERADRVKILKEFARVARVGVVFSFFDTNSLRARRRRRKTAQKGRLGGRHSVSRSECDEEAREAGLEPAGMTALLRFHAEVTAAACFCNPGAGVAER